MYQDSWRDQLRIHLQAQNSLTGTIPSMESLASLQILDMSKNKLSGPIPAHWASSNSLDYFSVEQNQLTGTIPVDKFADRYFGQHKTALAALE